MDNLDDSENNAKISDSAYSNSCSNSQSRRSHSSKSTHSGSNSSGSSGYGGKLSTSGSSNKLEQTSKKDKDGKKKKSQSKPLEKPALLECRPPEPIPLSEVPKEEADDVVETPSTPLLLPENSVDNINVSTSEMCSIKDEVQFANIQCGTPMNVDQSFQVISGDSEGFSCAISMHDGVVMYTTQTLTTNLGFPKDMWIGRSFIDFVHPRDRNTFASQITNGLAIPKIVNGTQDKGGQECTMVCRIRRYRSLGNGFVVKDRTVAYMPFVLKFSFKDIRDDDGKIMYLIIQATPLYSAFKTPNEIIIDPLPFVIRHSAAGILEYIDIESVAYLGYLPQDVQNQDALLMYHPDDLPYLKLVYEAIVKEGSVAKSMPYRMLAQNGDYVKLETEWSSFINPWSMKLEFVIGKHYVLEGPATPDVFLSPPPTKNQKTSEEAKFKHEAIKNLKASIIRVLKDVLTKPAEKAKQQMSKRCQDLALIMETLLEEQPKVTEELRVEVPEPDLNYYERDSVMLGGISPHHEYNDSMSSTGTPLSYNQLNYNENLQRYFDSHQSYYCGEGSPILALAENAYAMKDSKTIAERTSNCQMSPLAQHSNESADLGSCGSSNALMRGFSPAAPIGDFHSLRLTESLLNRHNNEMEKELAKTHREVRSCSKIERALDTRKKKKEHLARCNATFYPTLAGAATEAMQPHGVKRPSKATDTEMANKQHCSQSRQRRSKQSGNITVTAQPSSATTTTVGAMPMYYQSTAAVPSASHMEPQPCASSSHSHSHNHDMGPTYAPVNQMNYSANPVPWLYPHAVYGGPYMYQQMPYNIHQQQAMMAQSLVYNPTHSINQSLNPLGLTNSNYMQSAMMDIQRTNNMGQSGQNSDEAMDKTDGESSYSSFYSSFFKTESGSADDSSDPKKATPDFVKKNKSSSCYTYEPQEFKKTPRRKMDPPWMEQVLVTSDLLYKYQIPPKPKNEVLQADLEKMKKLEQPALVNEQLGQLYLDLALEGVTSRLTLEEGITSSSSSGEENCNTPKSKVHRRKREYSKLHMIYEEDAPLPPPSDFEDSICAEIYEIST